MFFFLFRLFIVESYLEDKLLNVLPEKYATKFIKLNIFGNELLLKKEKDHEKYLVN